ncbi:hypothetical protein GCM10029963_38880 [Micromonospora andamanensis]
MSDPNAQPGSPDKEPANEDQAARTALGNTERAEAATTPVGRDRAPRWGGSSWKTCGPPTPSR